MSRIDGEKKRIEHQLANLRGLLNGFESTFKLGVTLSEHATSVAHAALRLLDHACRLDAYTFVEEYALPPVCTTCSDTHVMSLRDSDVPCTRCPTPCAKCRAPRSAYCAKPRCTCGCHEGKR